MEKHIHKLRRHRFKSSNVVYFCATEDCKYKVAPALAIGKRALCWRCGNSFVMNEYSIRLARPHCDNCHQSRSEEGTRSVIPSIHPPVHFKQTPFEPLPTLTDLRSRLTNAAKPKDETDDDI